MCEVVSVTLIHTYNDNSSTGMSRLVATVVTLHRKVTTCRDCRAGAEGPTGGLSWQYLVCPKCMAT